MSHQATNSRIENFYDLTMPESLFAFWDFVHTATTRTFSDALHIMNLTGPFSLMQAGVPLDPDPLWQARHYNDPPEFLTLINGLTDGYHWGYYIDDPAQTAFPVASYYSNDAFEIQVVGADLFEAIRLELERHYRDCLNDLTSDPGHTGEYEAQIEQLDNLRHLLQPYGTADRQERGQDYAEKYMGVSHRQCVATTRDTMGIVVPPATYRPLREPDPFQKWDYDPTPAVAQQMTDDAFAALRAGFPGTALKLGKDLWVYHDHQLLSYALLDAAYDALHRPLLRRYLDIASRHRAKRDTKRSEK